MKSKTSYMRYVRPLTPLLFTVSVFILATPLFASAEVSTSSPRQIGYFCDPYSESFVSGGFYKPTSGFCTYEVGTVQRPFGVRYGAILKGVPGNAEVVNAHSLGNATTKIEFHDDLTNPQQGEDYFTLIWWVSSHFAAHDVPDFVNYFTTSTGTLPHNEYGLIQWKWGDALPLEEPSIDPVIIVPGLLGSEQKNGVWVIDPILHTFDDLIDTLAANGYTEGVDLFTFPYDWRRSNVDTAIDLNLKIEEVKQICNCQKVDLVAHSMGGLVARQYVQSDAYDDDVDQLIFLGTPHLGAPKAYLIWEAGEFGDSLSERFSNFVFSKEARKKGYEDLLDYIRNAPISSLSELLPIYEYLFSSATFDALDYPDASPRNLYLEGLNQNIALLNARVRVANIVGETQNPQTIVRYIVEDFDDPLYWEHGKPVEAGGIVLGEGDGTVPDISATLVSEGLMVLDETHITLPSAAAGPIYTLLTQKDPGSIVNNGLDYNIPLLIIKILSPADIQVTAPDGKRIGRDFETGQELNEIPFAFYSGFETDNEYITILNPLDGEYTVSLKGTDDGGAYTLAVAAITDEESTEVDVQGYIESGQELKIGANVNTEDPGELEVKPADTIPPSITIQSPEEGEYTRSEILPVLVTIADLDSGVLAATTTLDGVPYTEDTLDLFFLHLGEHVFSVEAEDYFHNHTATSTTFNVIATFQSTINDVERAYALGWITDTKIRDKIIDRLQKAVKIEKRIESVLERIPGRPAFRKKIEKFYEKIDKTLLKAVLRELEKMQGKGLNEQAYRLLEEDINWLLK